LTDLVNQLKIRYKIHIHRYPDDKKQKNRTSIVTAWKAKNSKYVENQWDFCCDSFEQAISYGYIVIVTDKNNFYHIKYDERKEELKQPVVCLRTFDEQSGSRDWDEALDEWNLPIQNCPFCTAKIETELVEKKKITHTCKKVQKTYESCEDETTEEIIK